jgi:hypothetical protein
MHPTILLACGRNRISTMAYPFIGKGRRLPLIPLRHMIHITKIDLYMQGSDVPKICDDHTRSLTTREMASLRRDVHRDLMAARRRGIAYSLGDYTSLKQT